MKINFTESGMSTKNQSSLPKNLSCDIFVNKMLFGKVKIQIF